LKFFPDFIRNHLHENNKKAANKKASQILDLQGLKICGGEGVQSKPPIQFIAAFRISSFKEFPPKDAGGFGILGIDDGYYPVDLVQRDLKYQFKMQMDKILPML
jgi:hypothetical protein